MTEATCGTGEAKQHNFEVIVARSTLAFTRDEDEETPSSKRFARADVDTKSKRRLYEVLQSQGFQLNQQITFLSDGGDSVRDLQLYMSPEAEHILDWFHLTMVVYLQPADNYLVPKTGYNAPLSRHCEGGYAMIPHHFST